MFRRVHFLQLAFVLLSASLLRADSAAFDLAGPRIEMRVTRAGKTLPISRVPNLQAGDRLWIHPDMPDGESVRFLMIAGVPARLDQSAAGKLVHQSGNLEQARARRRDCDHGSRRSAAGVDFPCSSNRRRFRHSAVGGAGQARRIRARVAGPESGQPGPFPSGQISERRQGNVRRARPATCTTGLCFWPAV